MNYFIKLNIFALLYGFVIYIQTELMGNVYRISRITNLSIKATNVAIGIAMLIIFISSTFIFFFVSSKYFNKGNIRYFLTILWIPYFIIYVWLTNLIIPITSPGDKPAPVIGLILFAFYFAYPFYIAIINAISAQK